jgi:C1A family cysteine protease
MIATLLLVALAACKFESEWNKFKIAYGKKYSPVEENERFKIFVDNMNYISLLNRIDKTATYGVTKFADLSAEEFGQKYLGHIPVSHEGLETYVSTVSAPSEWDWTSKSGYVSPVQDQGSCGSCWAFATSAGFETARVVAGNKLVKLSEQQLVDCDTSNSGCNGGNLTYAEKYIKSTGLVEESKYPYAGVDQTCKDNSSWTHYKATKYGIISGGEDKMADALYEHGPLPVAINANPVQFYTGGILDPSVCAASNLNHGVVIVGYGSENGTKFWKIRNSWGSSWGESGYFRMKRGSNTCGVANDATYIDA